jgi:hypothetical protein
LSERITSSGSLRRCGRTAPTRGGDGRTRAVVGEERSAFVVDRRPFELDEDQLVVDRGGLLLGRDERTVRRICVSTEKRSPA